MLTSEKISTLKSKIADQLNQLTRGRVLVVGDLCLDEYLMGEVKRISPEAPVPVVDVHRQETRLGLSANVAQNVSSLGGTCFLVGVVGDDATAVALKGLMKEAGLSDEHLLVDKQRPTTRKTRVMAGSNHIARVDFEQRKFLSDKVRTALLAKVSDLIQKIDVVVIEDYAKGVFAEDTVQQIIKMAHQAGKRVCVDPYRTTPPAYYRGADLFKPNRDEAFILSGLNIDDLREKRESLAEVAVALQKRVECEHLIITLGKEGISHFSSKEQWAIPTEAKQIFDVTGAGDTVIASLALAWASGFDLQSACVLANVAAGIVVGKIGCVPCYFDELKSALS